MGGTFYKLQNQWLDKSGLGNSSIPNGITSDSLGGVVFDGIDDISYSMNNNSLEIIPASLTLELWLVVNACSGENGGITKESSYRLYPASITGTTYNNAFRIATANNLWANTFLLGNKVLNVGEKHHLIMRYDSVAGKCTLFTDGVFDGEMVVTGVISPTINNVVLGACGTYYLNGTIYQSRIYNRALSNAEILQNYTGQQYIVSDTFTRADSATTLGNAETGQPWVVLNSTWGVSGSKAYCAGLGGDACIYTDSGVSDCEVSCDMLVPAAGVETWMVVRAQDNANFIMVGLNASSMFVYYRNGGVWNMWSNFGSTTLGTTYNFKFVLQGSKMILYVDSVLKSCFDYHYPITK